MIHAEVKKWYHGLEPKEGRWIKRSLATGHILGYSDNVYRLERLNKSSRVLWVPFFPSELVGSSFRYDESLGDWGIYANILIAEW